MKLPFFGKLLISSLLLAVAAAASAGPSVVDVTQGAALQRQGALLIDVREPDEYAQGHAPGSTLIPLGQLAQRLNEIKGHKDQPVLLVCRSGNRSASALQLLEKAGFTAATNVAGGMIAWQKAKLPVVTGAASR